MHTNSRDEALGLPVEESVRTALRTQQIIACESGVCNTVDPLAGSFYIEDLTDRIEREASALIDKIDHMGGMVAAIEAGEIQRQIEESAFQYQQQIDRNERAVVGVNCFQEQEPVPQGIFKLDKSVEENQTKRLAGIRAKRDNHAVKNGISKIRRSGTGQREPDAIDFGRRALLRIGRRYMRRAARGIWQI